MTNKKCVTKATRCYSYFAEVDADTTLTMQNQMVRRRLQLGVWTVATVRLTTIVSVHNRTVPHQAWVCTNVLSNIHTWRGHGGENATHETQTYNYY